MRSYFLRRLPRTKAEWTTDVSAVEEIAHRRRLFKEQLGRQVHVGPRPQLRGRRGHVGAEPDGGALRGAGAAFTSFHECDRGRKQVLVL